MYAGVPRVVASLWQVDDLATAELMKRFYRGMLSMGFRRPQRCAPHSGTWPPASMGSPYFWAPVVLQGDWR